MRKQYNRRPIFNEENKEKINIMRKSQSRTVDDASPMSHTFAPPWMRIVTTSECLIKAARESGVSTLLLPPPAAPEEYEEAGGLTVAPAWMRAVAVKLGICREY